MEIFSSKYANFIRVAKEHSVVAPYQFAAACSAFCVQHSHFIDFKWAKCFLSVESQIARRDMLSAQKACRMRVWWWSSAPAMLTPLLARVCMNYFFSRSPARTCFMYMDAWIYILSSCGLWCFRLAGQCGFKAVFRKLFKTPALTCFMPHKTGILMDIAFNTGAKATGCVLLCFYQRSTKACCWARNAASSLHTRGLLFGADKILISSGRDNKGPYFSGANINFQLLEETLGI